MEKFFNSNNNIPSGKSEDNRTDLEGKERREALLRQMIDLEAKVKEKQKILAEIEILKQVLQKRKKQRQKQEDNNQTKRIFDKTKKWFRRNAAILGIFAGTAAIAGTSTYSYLEPIKKEQDARFKKNKEEEKKSNELQDNVKEKIDKDLFNSLSDSAKKAYVSYITYDLKPKNLDDTSKEAIEQREKFAPKPATNVDVHSLATWMGEGKSRYDFHRAGYSAIGKYSVIPHWGFPGINLNPSDNDDIEYYLTHPKKQEEAHDTILARGERAYNPTGKHEERYFAGYFYGPDGVNVVGTPAGNDLVDANGNSVNAYVYGGENIYGKRLYGILNYYNEIKEATSTPGRWLTDKVNKKLYWIADGKPLYSADINEVVPEDKNEQYAKLIGNQENTETSELIAFNLKQEKNKAESEQKESKRGKITYNYSSKKISIEKHKPNHSDIVYAEKYLKDKYEEFYKDLIAGNYPVGFSPNELVKINGDYYKITKKEKGQKTPKYSSKKSKQNKDENDNDVKVDDDDLADNS